MHKNEKPRIGLLAYGILTLIIFIAVHLLFSGMASDTGAKIISKAQQYLSIAPRTEGTSDKETAPDGNDEESYIKRYGLPNLNRMSKEDRATYITPLLMNQKIEALNITMDDCLTPEKRWKDIYHAVNPELGYTQEAEFTGTTTSELNTFLATNHNKVVRIVNEELSYDQPINVPSNIIIQGAPTTIVGSNEVNGAIRIEEVENVNVSGLNIKGGAKGYFIKNCKSILIEQCEITDCTDYAMVLAGGSEYKIRNNTFDHNLGGITVQGGTNHSVIEENSILNGTSITNAMAGIVLDSSNYIVPEKYIKESTILETEPMGFIV